MSDGTKVIGCGTDWALLPLRREWARTENAQLLDIAETPVMLRKNLEKGLLSLVLTSPLHLIRQIQFELALPLGLSVRGGGLCYIGFTEAQLPLHERLMERLARLNAIFQRYRATDGEPLAGVAHNILRAAQSEAEPLEVPGLQNNGETGGALGRLLTRLLFGADASREREIRESAQSASLPLLEGNEAVFRRPQFAAIIDLGDLWTQWTGFPLVLQVWQKLQGREVKKSRLLKVAELAEARMKVEPSAYFPDLSPIDYAGAEIDLSRVWRAVTYRLQSMEMRGLLLLLYFFHLMEQQADHADVFTAKMIRWQQRDLGVQ